jgi:Spy/CpxP family protein refolding chaperone
MKRWYRSCLIGIALLVLVVLGERWAQAQPPGGFGAFGGFGGLADVLRREDVRKELELLEDQLQKLEKLAESRREKVRQAFSGAEGSSREERFQKMRQQLQKLQQETDREIGEVLLPHQMKRLRQLALQLRLRGGAQALLNDRTTEELGLSAEQKENLQKKAAEVEEQLRKKYAELRKQAQDEILRSLTPAQQAKWKELVGDPFEFQRTEPARAAGNNEGGRFRRGNR